MIKVKRNLEWKVGRSSNKSTPPDCFYTATVPGAVQLDWAKATNMPDYTFGDNVKLYDGLEDFYWTYQATVKKSEDNKRCFFVSEGIDYEFEILLDGKLIHAQEGMFSRVELELTDKIKSESLLEILIFPAPKRADAPVDRSQADHSCKPAVSYGWDWHPRLIPLGIWDETYIEYRNAEFIQNADVTYTLSEDLSRADVKLEFEQDLLWKIFAPDGKLVAETRDNKLAIENPLLWYCNGQGEPNMYTVTAELIVDGEVADCKHMKIGFRRARLIVHDGGWVEPVQFPKSRSNPPITLELNGRVVFAKGANWVSPDIFYGRFSKEMYEPLVKLAKDANMNILRVWGGGPVNKESFHELCDEMGIMVWAEFPLACNKYPDDEHYLDVLDVESRSIIKRLRKHPSTVMWCGGNELFNNWSKMTDQSLPLRLLGKNCYELDKHTPFIPTSPIMGMGHGNYVFEYFEGADAGRDVLNIMQERKMTAYTEFGMPSPSSPEIIAQIIPENEREYPSRTSAWITHHAFSAWTKEGDCWICLELLEKYFGKNLTYKQIYECGSWLQCEGYKAIFESARRQKPMCSMALNWCYNEPWLTAANNSLINYPALPKPSYYAVQASCRPVFASCSIPKFTWNAGELFEAELWILNDSYDNQTGGSVNVVIEINGERHQLLTWDFPTPEPNKNIEGPVVRWRLPDVDVKEFTIHLESNDKSLNSSYRLKFQPAEVVEETNAMNV